MGGLGVVALGIGTYLEVTGLSKRSQLDACRPTRTCTADAVDTAHAYVLAGDFTLGGGALFVAGAALLYLFRPTVEVPSKDGVGWTIGPAPGGIVAGVRGTL